MPHCTPNELNRDRLAARREALRLKAHAVDDVAQLTVIACWARRLAGHSNPCARAIARHKTYDEHRRRSRTVSLDQLLEDPAQAARLDRDLWIARGGATPEDALLLLDELSRGGTPSGLTALQSAVINYLHRRCAGPVTLSEVAAALHRSRSAIGVALRALAKKGHIDLERIDARTWTTKPVQKDSPKQKGLEVVAAASRPELPAHKGRKVTA